MEEDKVLLDYYTKSMVLHATIIVAVVFGLFSLLRIVANSNSPATIGVLAVAYVSLVFFGMYEIWRYKYYGDKAKEKAGLFGAKDLPKPKDSRITRSPFIQSKIKLLFKYAEVLFLIFMVVCLIFVLLDKLLAFSSFI